MVKSELAYSTLIPSCVYVVHCIIFFSNIIIVLLQPPQKEGERTDHIYPIFRRVCQKLGLKDCLKITWPVMVRPRQDLV